MKLETTKGSISVLGALNMDLIMNLERPAKPGETVVGDKYYTAPGGKGGNQAVAAARVSNTESVNFYGFTGNDNYGSELINYLDNEGILTSEIKIDSNNSIKKNVLFTPSW